MATVGGCQPLNSRGEPGPAAWGARHSALAPSGAVAYGHADDPAGQTFEGRDCEAERGREGGRPSLLLWKGSLHWEQSPNFSESLLSGLRVCHDWTGNFLGLFE